MHCSLAWRRQFLNIIQISASSSLQGFLPCYSTKEIPEETKACSLDVQGSELAVCPPPCPKDLKLHLFMVTVAQASLELHIPLQLLLTCENEVQHASLLVVSSITWRRKLSSRHSRNLLSCLCSSVLSLQWMSECWSSPWGPGFVNVMLLLSFWEGLIDSVFLVRWPVADFHYNDTCPCPPFIPDP